MIQFGQNAGPCHLRVFGHVCNLKDTDITVSERMQKNCRLLGAFGIAWNLLLAVSPALVIETCNKAMDQAGIP